MREIKFRGKAKGTGKWFYGDLIHKHGQVFIRSHTKSGIQVILVIPETVGQFTGLYDINDREIYEKDVAQATCIEDGVTYFGIIRYDYSGFYLHVFDYKRLGLYDNNSLIDLYELKNLQILGNIYDNPELLKK